MEPWWARERAGRRRWAWTWSHSCPAAKGRSPSSPGLVCDWSRSTRSGQPPSSHSRMSPPRLSPLRMPRRGFLISTRSSWSTRPHSHWPLRATVSPSRSTGLVRRSSLRRLRPGRCWTISPAALPSMPGMRDAVVAADGPGRRRLWALREGVTEAISSVGIPHKLDVGLPLGRLAAFVEALKATVAGVDADARIFVFGHLALGNLHVNVTGPASDDERIDEAVLQLVARPRRLDRRRARHRSGEGALAPPRALPRGAVGPCRDQACPRSGGDAQPGCAGRRCLSLLRNRLVVVQPGVKATELELVRSFVQAPNLSVEWRHLDRVERTEATEQHCTRTHWTFAGSAPTLTRRASSTIVVTGGEGTVYEAERWPDSTTGAALPIPCLVCACRDHRRGAGRAIGKRCCIVSNQYWRSDRMD